MFPSLALAAASSYRKERLTLSLQPTIKAAHLPIKVPELANTRQALPNPCLLLIFRIHADTKEADLAIVEDRPMLIEKGLDNGLAQAIAC